jgi:hypothetical protein
MATKKHFFRFGSFSINDGSQIRFWEDRWLGNSTLREQSPALYTILWHKRDTIYILSPPNVLFRQLSVGFDEFWWNLHANGNFLVDFLYKAIIQSDIPFDNNKEIWKIKIPLKTKIFAWYLRRGVFLTKYNLVKWNWHGMCFFLSSRWDNQTHNSNAALPDMYGQSSK